MKLLIALLLVLVAIAGTAVVLSRSAQRQVFAMSANGLLLALLFMALQAPDAAFAEIVVGAVALPFMFFVLLASAKMDRTSSSASAAEKQSERAER